MKRKKAVGIKKVRRKAAARKQPAKKRQCGKEENVQHFSNRQMEAIFNVVREVAGEDTIPIVRILLKKRSISEYDIANMIKRDINQTRNLLYALHKSNLVYSIRKKDKIKGWYIYYWSFDGQRVFELYKKINERRVQHTKSLIEREDGNCFFACPNHCIRLDFEQVMNFNFKCPECGSLMEREDNTKKVESLKKDLLELSKQCKRLGL